MPKRIDLVGMKINEWEVLEYAGDGYWKCKCSCGVIKNVNGNMLRHNKTKSCGHASPKAFKDLKGMHFGEWEALEYLGDCKWSCRCSCGKIQAVGTYQLISGKSLSCGHATTGLKDLTGQRFGEWTARRYMKNGYWECECSCGEIRNVLASSLLQGKSTSCGHNTNKFIDLKGKVFDDLEVIEYNGDGYWKCKCSCGKIINVHGYSLKSGNTKSCGHAKLEHIRKTKLDRYGEVAITKIDNPRELWQIEALKTKENMLDYLNQLEYTPTYTDLTHKLGINYSTISQKIRKFGLEEYINISDIASDKERELAELVKSLTDSEVITNDRSVIAPYDLDIYIPDKKLAIEFNGNYWHSTPLKDKRYHQIKTIETIRKGIQLIHIFEYEWDNQRDLISAFIKDRLQKSTIIYARNTKVIQLNQKETTKFINKYHLQGYTKSEIDLGLVHNDELIGVMTFGKPRFNNAYEWELIRLCYKTGITVVGGTNKLFQRFIRDYDPSSIISYCDISKFSGRVYAELGMVKEDRLTEPNYVWVNQYSKVLSRYQTMKGRLISAGIGDISQTEDEIMRSLDYMKVYNCGNAVYKYIKHTF